MIVDPSTFTDWAAMRSRVLRKAPECPGFRIDSALKEAAAEFFEKSRVWRTSRDTILTTAADTLDYAFTPPTNAEVHEVFSAWYLDDEVDVLQPGEQYEPDQTTTTDDYKVGARPTNVLFLTQLPATASREIKGVLAMKPSVDAVGIPTDAWTKWGEDLAMGAAALLVLDMQKPWSNPRMYADLRSMFADGIRDASESAGPVRRKSLRSLAV
jgi:hypothetical protein